MSAQASAAGRPVSGAAAAAGQPQRREQKGIIGQLVQALAVYFLITTVSSYFLGGKSPIANLIQRASPGPSSGGDPAKEVRVPDQQQKQQGTREATAISIFPANSELSLSVYLSAGQLDLSRPSLPHHTFEPVRFGDWNFSQTWETSFKVPASVQNNGTLIAEMFLSVGGATIDPRDPSYDVTKVSHTRKLLSRYAPERRVKAVKNLLGSHNRTEDEIKAEEAEASRPLQITSFYHPNLTLALINEPMLAMTYLAFPPAVQQHVRLAPGMPDPEKLPLRRYMYPIVFPHDFWLLKEHMQPINDTVEELPLRIDFWPQSAWKFQLFATMDASMQEASKTGQSGAAELDEVKRMLTETNPILLVTTLVVTLLHTLFEFLAFSSDVSHWRKKKELVGVSVRTILANVFVQLVILLYLVDNNENTSWVILGSSGVGLAIEAWKITKAVDIKVLPAAAGSLLPYKLEVHDKHVLSEEELKTQEYDRLAFRLVSYVTIPLLGGYTIYSVIYETHRGWYSFIITTLTQFVYMFGFVQLVPQLIINYKLKSVAHLPMKALIYKTLTTVVDDFFAFCIRMPWLHRVAAFRDDVIFVVLLYQYWIYRVDYNRVNEYGQAPIIEESKKDAKVKENLETKKKQ